MTKSIQQELLSSRQDYTSSPGRILDTIVELSDGACDVQLTDAKLKEIAKDASGIRDRWETLNAIDTLNSQERLIVEKHLAEIALVSCVAEQALFDIDVSDEIGELEHELYDYYNPDLFVAALQAKREQLLSLDISKEYEAERTLAIGKLDAYIEHGDADKELARPTPETLQVMQNWLYDQYGDLLDEIDSDGIDKYSAEQIVEYFQKAVNSTPALYETGWSVEAILREKSEISVQASHKKIVVPTQRKVSSTRLKGLVVHEVFGHALRSAIAEQHGLVYGQHGTASYARFEEAFMIALEQCLKGIHDPLRGAEHYIATGLSVTEGLSKESIADLLGSMAKLKNIAENKDDSETKAISTAKSFIRRTFSGMMDVDDGIAHRKDIDYYHGLNDAWRFLNHITEHDIVDEGVRWALSAKFNPMVASDRDYVDSSAPMPCALKDLFDEAA